MPICQNCNKEFPCRVIINDKHYMLHKRKYCIDCNPIGERRFWSGKQTQGNINLLKNRICITCGKKFYQKSPNSECSTCRAKTRRKQQKEKIIEYLGGKCKVCGYNKCRQALDVHHLDKSKKLFNISTKLYNSIDFLKKEADKCVLLCNRCHQELHAELITL